MCIVLIVIGGLGFIPKTAPNHTDTTFAIGAMLIMLNFVYNMSLGPVCYTLIGELSSTRLRQKTIALSRIAYKTMNIICGIIVPRMLSPKAWNWGPKSGIFVSTPALKQRRVEC